MKLGTRVPNFRFLACAITIMARAIIYEIGPLSNYGTCHIFKGNRKVIDKFCVRPTFLPAKEVVLCKSICP
jgi:hypothetical protein